MLTAAIEYVRIIIFKYECMIFRIFGEYTMETILATAFGHKVEILRGEAGGDTLTTATAGLFASISLAGPTGINAMVALMCELDKSA